MSDDDNDSSSSSHSSSSENEEEEESDEAKQKAEAVNKPKVNFAKRINENDLTNEKESKMERMDFNQANFEDAGWADFSKFGSEQGDPFAQQNPQQQPESSNQPNTEQLSCKDSGVSGLANAKVNTGSNLSSDGSEEQNWANFDSFNDLS